MANVARDLQEIYNEIKESGKHNVDGIVQWLQDAKVIDQAQHTEERVRSYFANAADKNNITAEKFKEAMNEIANDQKRNVDELCTTLTEYSCKLLNALKAGATAFKEAMQK